MSSESSSFDLARVCRRGGGFRAPLWLPLRLRKYRTFNGSDLLSLNTPGFGRSEMVAECEMGRVVTKSVRIPATWLPTCSASSVGEVSSWLPCVPFSASVSAFAGLSPPPAPRPKEGTVDFKIVVEVVGVVAALVDVVAVLVVVVVLELGELIAVKMSIGEAGLGTVEFADGDGVASDWVLAVLFSPALRDRAAILSGRMWLVDRFGDRRIGMVVEGDVLLLDTLAGKDVWAGDCGGDARVMRERRDCGR